MGEEAGLRKCGVIGAVMMGVGAGLGMAGWLRLRGIIGTVVGGVWTGLRRAGWLRLATRAVWVGAVLWWPEEAELAAR